MGIRLCSWRIFLCVLALVIAERTSARKLTNVPWKEGGVDPIGWIYSKQKVIDQEEQLAEAASARKPTDKPWREIELDPIDHDSEMGFNQKQEIVDFEPHNNPVDDQFWIYSKPDDHEGHRGSLAKEQEIERVTRPNSMDDLFWIYSKQNDQKTQENGHDDDLLLKVGKKDDHEGQMDMEHSDPSHNVFFTPRDLKVGKRMKVYFPNKDPSTSPRFLPREEAESIPFSSSQLPYLLELFSLPKDSPQAKAIEDTLSMCEHEPIKGETKVCATSFESMIDFARSSFGLDTQLKILTNKPLTKPIRPLQNYTILEEPKEIIAPKMVGCHTMPYPYVVYYCHSQEGHQAKVFQVLLGGEDGERMLAAAVCHMDTSHWDRDHISFRVLKIKPGAAPVCHFFPQDNMVWLPVTA